MTLLCFLLLIAPLGADQPATDAARPAAVASEALRERVTKRLQTLMEESRIPGLSAAVVVNGKPACSVQLGVAHVEHDARVRPETVFRIGGVSMPVTSVGLLRLVQDGRIGLDASVRDYVPEYPDKGKPLTLRSVLAHQSGIRPEKSLEEWTSRQPYPTLLAAIEPFKQDPLLRDPGESFIVSNFGYTLLGLVIERVSSLPYDEYIRTSLARPLGLESLRVDDPRAIIPHRAAGYALDGGALRNAEPVDVSVRVPGSGLVATADDLARFAAAVLDGRALGDELRTLMFAEQPIEPDRPSKYGLGWFVREDGGRRIVGHSGPEIGYSAFLVIYPDDKAAVVILTNLQNVNLSTAALEIGRMALELEPPEAGGAEAAASD